MPSGKVKKASNTKSLRELEKEIPLIFPRNIVDGGIITKSDTLNLGDAIQNYLAIAKSSVSVTTFQNYLAHARRISSFGWDKLKICDFSVSSAKKLIQETVDKGASTTVAKYQKSFLYNVFQMVYEDDLISKNPFNFKFFLKCDIGKINALTVEEQEMFLSFLLANQRKAVFRKVYNNVRFLLNTGLRISEFCGITLNDIDLSNRIVCINKQIQQIPNGQYFVTPPKSESGNRIVPLNNDAICSVEWFISQREAVDIDYRIGNYKDFLLLNNRGKPMVSALIYRQMKRIVDQFNEAADTDIKISPHILRHTFATNCIRRGVSLKTVQTIMGHSSYNITMDTYTHFSTHEIISEFFEYF